MRIRLGVPLKLFEIAEAVDGECTCEKEIEYISTDTREIEYGDLFVAIGGKNFNGEDFVHEAIRKGAIPLSNGKVYGGIIVSNTKDALLKLADFYKTKLKKLKYTVGITGSVGKTTTKEFLKVICSTKYKTHATTGNFNNEIGLPLTVLSAPPDTEILILEMGMNHQGEISRLSRAAKPDIAIITNIGTAHIGNLRSRENIAKAKLEILEGMNGGCVIVPKDESLFSNLPSAIYYSVDECLPDNLENNRLTILKNGEVLLKVIFPFFQKHLGNCLAPAAIAAEECGLNYDELIRGVSLISNDNIRQSIVFLKNLYFYKDYYNSSYESVRAALASMKELKGYSRKSILLGDVLELGEHSESIHRKIGEMISPNVFHNLFLFGDSVRFIYEGAKKNGFSPGKIHLNLTCDYERSAKQVLDNSIPQEIILIKGSRGMKLERIIEYISKEIS